jgi:hypothetical protein
VLRAGACVSESELHEHAQRTIGERPAWPKQFHIVDAIPVTSVGKIFKPELCCYAAARLVRGVLLEQHRLPDAQVRVSAGGTRGLIVSVTLPSTAQAALRPSHRRWPVICSRPASRSPDLRHGFSAAAGRNRRRRTKAYRVQQVR